MSVARDASRLGAVAYGLIIASLIIALLMLGRRSSSRLWLLPCCFIPSLLTRATLGVWRTAVA